MSDVTLDQAALEQLNSDQKALLDTIDSLRTIGVEKYAPLPQLIVVGDQSSGKSSVLEAISRVRFPVKGGICTRFATELVLRTAPTVQIDVSIKRHESESLSAVTPDVSKSFSETSFSKDALPEIIEEAKRIMGIRDGTTSFSEDVLRVKISGPDLPELTLVDLPGFFETGTAEQSQDGRSIVTRLVQKYMRQKNSIILAVVSARVGVANQKVLREAKVCDPQRERTIGIVTKPDSVTPGSDDEDKYIQLVRNKEPEHVLKLGWHVLRNRAENEVDLSDEERDTKETEFLQSGRWRQISFRDRGVEPLRRKLSKELVSHIQSTLPTLIAEIERHRAERHDRLTQLGRPRSSADDLRIHLSGLAHQYEKISSDAIEGTYRDPFFPGLYAGNHSIDESDVRRLRAVIRNMNRVFDALISYKGAAESIISVDPAVPILQSTGHRLPVYLIPLADLYHVEEPKITMMSVLKAKLEVAAAKTQGSEFPGSSNDNLALDLFRHQSSRWEEIAKRHIELVIGVCRSFVDDLFDHIIGGDPSTRNAIVIDRVIPFFNQCTIDLNSKLDELLHHYKNGLALPLEAEFLDKLGSKTKTRLASQVKSLLKPVLSQLKGEDLKGEMIDDAIKKAPETEVTKFGVERVIDIMAVYYEMSLRTFVENVIILAVENCLVRKIPSIFTSRAVAGMEPEKLKGLAAESADIQAERNELSRDLGILNEALEQCRIYKPREQIGLRQSLTAAESKGSLTTPKPKSVLPTEKDSKTATKTSSIFTSNSTPSPAHQGIDSSASSSTPKTSPSSAANAPKSIFDVASTNDAGVSGKSLFSNVSSASLFAKSRDSIFGAPPSSTSSETSAITQTSVGKSNFFSSNNTGTRSAPISFPVFGGGPPSTTRPPPSPVLPNPLPPFGGGPISSTTTSIFGTPSTSSNTIPDTRKLHYNGYKFVPLEDETALDLPLIDQNNGWDKSAHNNIAVLERYRHFSPEELKLRRVIEGLPLSVDNVK